MAGWKKIIHSGSSADLIRIRTDDGTASVPAYSFIDDTDTGIFQPETNGIAFTTDGSEKLRIKPDGNVGIGTNAPGEKLEVDGIIKVVHTDDSYANYRGNGVFFNRTDSYLSPLTDNTSTLNIGYNGGKWGNVEINGAIIRFENGPNEFARITSTGNVGIGTPTPNDKLQVYGNATYISVKNTSNKKVAVLGSDSSGDGSLIIRDSAGNNKISLYGENGTDSYINNGGKVGIGLNTTLYQKFTVNGNIDVRGGDGCLLTFNNGDGGIGVHYNDADGTTGRDIAFKTYKEVVGNTEKMRITKDGKVGIGTATPDATLEVAGNVKAISFTGSLSGSVSHALVADSVTDATLLSQSNLWYNGTTYLSSSVNVGIGTNIPNTPLHVYAPESTIKFESSHGRESSINQGGGNFHLHADHASGVAINYGNTNPGLLKLYSDTTSKVQISAAGDSYYNGGNVGIGITSPSAKLHISASSGTNLLELTKNSGYVTSIDMDDTGLDIGHNSDGRAINLKTANEDRLTIKGDGKVGIGTSTPSGPLHVKGSTNDTVVYIDTDDNAIGDSAKISFNGSRAHIGWIDSAVTLTDGGGNKDIKLKVDNASIFLETNNTTRMFVSASGNVGIGTTSPATKLDVNGITTSDAFRTDTSTTDYSLITRNSAGNSPLYVQSANTSTDQPIAFFSYGSATANAGTKVLKVGKDISYFDNTNLGIGTTTPPKALTVQGDISGSGDLYTAGNHIIGGSTAHNGYQIIEDQIVVRSGSSIFGHDTDPAEAFHQFTGSVSITGSLIVTGNVTGNSDTATVATTVTITDNESTNENNALIFTAGGAVAGGNLGLESDGTLTYNPSTGNVTATGFIGTLTGNADTATSAVTVGTTPTNNTAMDFNIGMFAGTSGNQYMMVDNNGGLQYNPSTNTLTVPNISANLTGDVTGDLTGNADSANFAQNALDATNATNATNATKVNINNKDTGDTNCPILFTLDSSAGFKSVFEDSALYFNATNNILYSTTFSGALTGTATNASNVKVTADSGNAEHPITFIDDTSPDGGNESLKADAAFKYNPGTDTLTVGKLLLNSLVAGSSSDLIVVQDSSGNLKTANLLTTDGDGNLASQFAGQATNALHVNLSTTTNNDNYPIPFQFGTSTAAGNFAMAKDSVNSLTYNPSSNTLTVPNIVGTLTGNADTATSATNADTLDGIDSLQFLRSDQDDTATGDITFAGDIYGRYVNNQSTKLYRMGGIFFTWDSDNYGTNFNHSITSTNNGTYNDNITINSYGHVRINIDSNNNGTNTFSIGKHTTGTANTLLTLNESGILSVGDLQLTALSTQNSENTSLMIDSSGNVGTRELGSNAFNSTTIPTNNNQLTNGAGYITSADVDGFTETEIEITMAREAGWEPAFGGATEANVIWDQSEDAIKIYSATDNAIGAAFRAVYMKSGETKRFTTMIKGSVVDTNGAYLRLYQHNGDMPNGKTHVSNNAGSSSPFVQEDDTGIENWHDNGAVSTSWVTYEYDYTATADGYVSLVVLNWSTYSYNTLWVKTPDIQTVTMANATNADHVDIDTITSGIARLLVADHPGDNFVGSQDGYKQVYGEDALFWDGTNHQLGINCNPSFALEVAGEAHISGKVSCGNDISASGQIYATSVNIMDEIGHIGDSDTKIEFTSDDIEFYAGNRKMLRLNENSSTDYVIMDTDYFQIQNENSSDSTKFLFHVESGNNSTYNGNIYLSTDGMEIFTNSSVRKIMMGNDNRRTDLVINSNGDVGIGTSSPSANLEVYRNNSDTDKQFSINQDGDGDATQTFRLTGIQEYAMGIDHSDGDKFKISDGGQLGSSDRLTIDTNGDVGISKNSPAARLDIVGPDYNATLATSVLGLTSTGNALQWQFGVSNTYGTNGALYIEDDSSNQGIKLHPDFDGGDDDFRNLLTSFTGYHRSVPKEGDGNTNLYPIGTIVSSNGSYNNPNSRKRPISSSRPNISEAVPVIEMSNIAKDKKVFGVVWRYEYKGESLDEPTGNICSFMGTGSEDRIFVNSLGEGAIWVTNASGNLENGDYITTSPIPGLGMKQDDDLLHNYTVAKITQDCDFQIDSDNYDCIEFEWSGSTYRKAFVGCTYHCG
mgnify:CR=1 FL=1